MENYNDWGSMTTSEDLVRQLLTSVLDQAAPGAGGFMTNLLLPQLRRMTGNDALWDVTLTTDMTSEGVYRHQQRRQLAQMEGSIAQAAQQEATRNAFRNIEMTKLSFEDWKLQNPNQSYEDYEADIRKNVDSAMSNKFYQMGWGLVNNKFNLDGTAGVGQAIGQVASNLARYGFYRNDSSAMSAGRMFAENLFKTPVMTKTYDENMFEREVEQVDEATGRVRMQEKPYDRREWGGMSQRVVSELAANITKDTDLLRGLDTSSGAALSKASKAFTDMVHQYAEALAPLRDMFGDDAPRMISALQRMTGQTLSQLGPMRAAILSTQLSDRANAGRYSMSYLNETTQAMTTLLEHAPDLNSYHYLNAGGMGMRAADMAQGGGFKPSYMTNEEWTRAAEKTAFSTSTSQATNAFALDYAIWANKKLRAGATSATYEDFQKEIDKLTTEKGIDSRVASGMVSGARTWSEKQEGLAYSQYGEALASGDAARTSSQGALRQIRQSAERAANMKLGLRKMIDNVFEGETDKPDHQEIIRTAMDTVMQIPGVQGQSPEQVAKFLEGKTVNGKTIDAKHAQAIAGVINTFKASKKSSPMFRFIQRAAQFTAEEDMQAFGKNATERKKNNEEAEKAMFSENGIVMQLFEGGFSIDRVKNALQASEAIRKNGDLETNSAIMHAAMQSAKIRYKTDAEAYKTAMESNDEEGIQKARQQFEAGASYVKRFHAYAISAEGQSTAFRNEVEAYKKAMKADDKEGMEKARRRMDAYMTFGIKATDMYVGRAQYDEQGNKVTEAGSVDNLRNLAGMSHDDLMMANARSEVFGLSDTSIHRAAKTMYKDFLKEHKGASASELAAKWEEKRTKLLKEDEENRKAAKKQFDEQKKSNPDLTWNEDTTTRESVRIIDRIMGSAGQGIMPMGGSADRFDLVTVLKQLVDALQRLSTDGNSVLRARPEEGTTPG